MRRAIDCQPSILRWAAGDVVGIPLIAITMTVLAALLTLGPLAPFTFGTADAETGFEAQADGPPLTTGNDCFWFYIKYTDGHVDRSGVDEFGRVDPDAPVYCGKKMNVTPALYPSLHVPVLHVSCSDPGLTEAGGELSASELAGHTVLVGESGSRPHNFIVKPHGAPCGGHVPPPSTPDEPNVGIAKSSNVPTGIAAGDSFTWTLTVESNGDGDAENVVVTDEIPAGLTVNSTSPPPSSVSGSTYTWELGNLATGSSTTIDVAVTTSPEHCPAVTNHASVSATDDGDSSDNSDSDSVDVLCEPDVIVEKDANKETVAAGGRWTYELLVTNVGDGIAEDVTVTDDLPTGVTFMSASAGCTESSGTVTCDLDTVQGGEAGHVSITVQADDGTCGDVDNTGVVSASNEPQASSGNNTSNPVTVTIDCQAPCVAPVNVELREDSVTGNLIGPGEAEVNGSTVTIDSDGLGDAGNYSCGENVAGELTDFPKGHVVVQGVDRLLDLPEAGGTLVFVIEPVPSPCVGPVNAEVRHEVTGELVGGGHATVEGTGYDLDADGDTDVDTFDCGEDVHGILDTAPDDYVIVDGDDRIEAVTADGGTLVFTVREPTTPQPCVGPLTIEVVDADSGGLVGGGQASVEGEAAQDLDGDGSTTAGDWDCDRIIDGELTTPPIGYEIVDASDQVVMDENGETLRFVVRQPRPEIVCEGELIVRIVDTEGDLVAGGEVNVGAEGYVLPDGQVLLPGRECGRVTVTLDESPPGTVPVGPTIKSTEIEHERTSVVEFVVDSVEVLPEPPIDREPPVAPEDPVASEPPQVRGVTSDRLPRTGSDTGATVLLALLATVVGAIVVRITRPENAGEEA